MAMKHDKAEEQTREWPARAADLQQEPAIPDDVVFPPDAEKPDKAIPKETSGEKVPANDDDAEDDKPAKKKAASRPDESEKRPAAKKSAETRKG